MSVPIGDLQATFAATLVDEWVRAGVRDAVVCPGSRSTPLALALVGRDELRVHVRLDERGACFYALGLTMASGMATVVCTTSGTAAAELHAGVVEASHARVPLIVCTCDRPPRLHHVGAPQTIEQADLFGAAAVWRADPGLVHQGDQPWWRSLAARAVAESRSGPVHLNLAFEEPLLGTAGPLPPARNDGSGWQSSPGPAATPPSPPGRWSRRGILVAGQGAPADQVLRAADVLGWPVLADPRSGTRLDHPAVVAAADAILRDEALAATLEPETIVLVGQPWVSRVLTEFVTRCARAGAHVAAVGPAPSDPGRVVSELHPGDAAAFFAAIAPAAAAPPSWRDRWERVEQAAQGAIVKVLENDRLCAGGRATEPGVARHLFASVGSETSLFVSSSMPVRDLEWYGAPRSSPPVVRANRGVSGIDGVTSSALGLAAASRGPVVGLLGDLAFFHDVSALASVDDEAGSCTLVVLDNGGGGIFSFLPQAGALDPARFERLFGTRPRASVVAVARGFGLPTAEASTLSDLDEALEQFVGRESQAVVAVRVPGRDENVALHDRLHDAVVAACREVG
ncbi:MAG: 2-succinyl-5-enolpyruvyl-6-hydroxy-3-cyclohexene-1-carboxylic-acid synthase [Acidimicrobiales bacterium]